jgi:hypothetical protein
MFVHAFGAYLCTGGAERASVRFAAENAEPGADARTGTARAGAACAV